MSYPFNSRKPKAVRKPSPNQVAGQGQTLAISVLVISDEQEKRGKQCLLSCMPLICSITKAYRWNSRPLLPRDRPRALLAPAASMFPRPGTVQRAWTSSKRHAGSSIIASAPSMLPRQTFAEFPASQNLPAPVRNGDRSLLTRASSGKQASI